MVEVRFTEPALDTDRDRAGFLGGAVRGGKRLGLGGQLVERGPFDRLAGLDDHHGRPSAGGDRLRQCAEQVRLAIRPAGLGRGAHDDQVRALGLAQDGVPDVRRLAQDGLAATGDVLLDEGGEGAFGLGPDGKRDARRDQVEDDDRRVVMPGDRIGKAQGELRVWSAADRDEDAPDLLRAALLDDSDVARRFADDLVDRRREDGRARAVATAGCPAAPAEDDEVGLLLGRGLDDPLGGVSPDPDDRMDGRAIGRVVEHALEESPGVPGARRSLGQRHALGDLDDAECRDLAGSRVDHRCAELDQLLGRHRVGDRDQDADRERGPGGHRAACAAGPAATASFQRVTRYGLSSSNSRAWRSTRSSAWSVVTLRFSMTKLATRPK